MTMGSAHFLLVVPLFCLIINTTNAQTPEILTLSIQEEEPSGTLIASLRQDARLASILDQEESSQISFAFLPQSTSSYQGLFSLDSLSGEIRTARRIDRDVICPRLVTCDVFLDVKLLPLEYFRILRLQISIQDINDNAPTFSDRVIAKSLSESSPVGTTFTVPGANDPDSPAYGVQQYQIETESDTFGIVDSRESNWNEDIELVLLKALDREVKERYSITLQAVDGGRAQPRSGTLTIDVTVADVNDNSPRFTQAAYDVTVGEDLPVMGTVLRVRASDPDSGVRGDVEYSLASRTLDAFGETFAINQTTGDIYIKRQLDYEDRSSYQLIATARDKAPGSLPTQTRITVRVLDLNDNAPTIRLMTEIPEGKLQIQENLPPGIFLAHLSVSDADDGVNGQFTCQLNSSFFKLEQLYVTDYKLVTSHIFDREERDWYLIVVVCLDKGPTPLTTSLILPVEVADVNDETPTFLSEVIRVNIPENTPVGQQWTRVTATDLDTGENARVTYSLLTDNTTSGDLFMIDPDTGALVSNVKPDREITDEYNVTVVARDHGQPSRTSTTVVMMYVTDEDDNSPIFNQSFYNLSVPENFPGGTLVGHVVALDRDLPQNGALIYDIQPPAMRTLFSIDRQSGAISTTTILDRETIPRYVFSVRAVSNTEVRYVTSAMVAVTVLDENDNAPQFLFPVADNNTVYVKPSATAVGDVIANVETTDADIAENDICEYTITAGNDDGVFSINSHNGSVIAETSLVDTHTDTFILVIQVSDCGSPSKNISAILKVTTNPIVETYVRKTSNRNILITIVIVSVLLVAILIMMIVLVTRWRRRVQRKKGWLAWMVEHRIRLTPRSMGAGRHTHQHWDYLPDSGTDQKVAPPADKDPTEKTDLSSMVVPPKSDGNANEKSRVDDTPSAVTIHGEETQKEGGRPLGGPRVRRKLLFDPLPSTNTDSLPRASQVAQLEVILDVKQLGIGSQVYENTTERDPVSRGSTEGSELTLREDSPDSLSRGLYPSLRSQSSKKKERPNTVRFNLVPEVTSLPREDASPTLSLSSGSLDDCFREHEI